MRSFRIVGAGLVTAIAVALAVNGTSAQAATSAQVGQPLPLLAGLRPPHESKHPVHAKTAHPTIKRTAAKKSRHGRMVAEHRRHIPARKVAKNEHREHAIAASAFAEEPPAQTAPNPAPTDDWLPANAPSSADSAAAPAPASLPSASPPPNVDPTPSAMEGNGQPAQMNSPNQPNPPDPAARHDTPPATAPNDQAAVTPQTVLAAPVHQDVSPADSSSWIAQVLAALGGAAAAGMVAWFLIGSGPMRTYG
jgi:hypothetical protein